MMIVRALVLGLALLQLSACSGGGGGGSAAPATPLTKEQKEKLDLTAQNVSEVTGWDTKKTQAAATEPTGATPFLAIATQKRPDMTQTKSEIQAKIFDPGSCDIKMLEPKAPSEPSGPNKPMDLNLDSGVSIGGPNCPISFGWSNKMNMKMDNAALTQSLDGAFAIHYSAQSAQAKMMDVEFYQIDIKMAMNAGPQGASGTVGGSGKIVSRSQGTISIAISGDNKESAQGSLATMVVKMSYPDGMNVEFKNVTTRPPGENAETVNSYFINNVKISEEEFNLYSKSFGMDKFGDQRNESQSEHK